MRIHKKKQRIHEIIFIFVGTIQSQDADEFVCLELFTETDEDECFGNMNDDEDDGKDECLVPLDYKESGLISDDHLNNILSPKFSNFEQKFCK